MGTQTTPEAEYKGKKVNLPREGNYCSLVVYYNLEHIAMYSFPATKEVEM